MTIDPTNTFSPAKLPALAVALLAGASCSLMAESFDGFGGVRFVMPQIRESHRSHSAAMELSDGRMFESRLNRMGPPLGQDYGWSTLDQISLTHSWWGSEAMVRMSYGPRVFDDDGEFLFQIGGVEKPEEGRFDYADREKREAAARAMAKTSALHDGDWIMFDEPVWGHRGMDKPGELPISEALKRLVHERTGRPFAGLEAFTDDPEAWHAFAYERQLALVEALKAYSVEIRNAGKKVAINLFPAALESGSVGGFEIATAMKVFGEHIDLIQIDPYYTLFVEDPRYAGFMLRLLDDSTPRDLPMLGWIDGVDGLAEELAIKLPPATSMKPQLAAHLANGSDHLAIWSYAYMERMGNLDAFLEMARWIRENQVLYRGNPALHADTGLYYSNLTVAMQDYFPKAWSHGTGPFGQYFTALNTYYMTVANHVPVKVLSTPLGHEEALAEKLAGLKRLIVADARVMTDREIDIIREWVERGGVLINIGRSGVLDEFRQARPGGLAGVAGIAMTDVRPRGQLVFTDAWSGQTRTPIAINGSNETVFIERYQSNRQYALNSVDRRAHYYPKRWPLHLRSAPLADTVTLADPQPTDWLPEGASGVAESAGAAVLARFENNEAAIVAKTVGRGRVIQIAPTDWLTRYRDPQVRRTAGDLFHRTTSSPYRLSGEGDADLASVEFVPTERRGDHHRTVMLHLVRHVHDDQAIVAGSKPLGRVSVHFDLGANEDVAFVTGFSPDTPKPGVTYRKEGRRLDVTMDALSVYNAVLIGLKPATPPVPKR